MTLYAGASFESLFKRGIERMHMKRYFRSEYGPYKDYVEFDDEYPIRAVKIYEGVWSWASEDEHRLELPDQPLSSTDLGPEHTISKEMFEAVWNEAQKLSQ